MSLFIFKTNARGMQYFMGTYVRELTEALLRYTDIIIYTVNYNNGEFKEFSIETVNEVYIPVKNSPRIPRMILLEILIFARCRVNVYFPLRVQDIVQVKIVDTIVILVGVNK